MAIPINTLSSYPKSIYKTNKGKKWFCDVENGYEYFTIPTQDYLDGVENGILQFGRLPKNKPPKKIKGCRRYREAKSYTYRRPDGSTFTVPEEIFHLKKEYFRRKGYKLCRRSPYSYDESLSEKEKLTLEEMKKEYLRKKSEFMSNRMWITSLGKPVFVDKEKGKKMLEFGCLHGRKLRNPDGSYSPAFHRK